MVTGSGFTLDFVPAKGKSEKMKLFGTSGIRGIVGQLLTEEFCRDIGKSIGSILPEGSKVCIATDARLSRDQIRDWVTEGLLSTGIDVTHFGILPTPALAFLTRKLGFDTGLMLTASHNPPEYNGIKVFSADTIGYSIAQEDKIEAVFRENRFRRGKGRLSSNEQAGEIYKNQLIDIFSGKPLNRNLKIVVDPGNGAAAGFASDLFRKLGLNIIPVNDYPDGNFPGRPSEPNSETLQSTISYLREKEADLAICFDGDADRVVFCDREGFLGFTEMVSFMSGIFVRRSGKKKVATTVEVGKLLDFAMKGFDARVERGKVGDVHLAHLTQKHDAAIGIEDVGVYIVPEMGWYPESMFAALMLLSETQSPKEIRGFLETLPRLFSQKGKVSCPNEGKEKVMAEVKQRAATLNPMDINHLDGIRMDFDDASLLIRPSGTEPLIRIMAESGEEIKTRELVRKGTALIKSAIQTL